MPHHSISRGDPAQMLPGVGLDARGKTMALPAGSREAHAQVRLHGSAPDQDRG